MALTNMNVVEELKGRTEFLLIGFNYKEHADFIEKIKDEALDKGLFISFGGEFEEQ